MAEVDTFEEDGAPAESAASVIKVAGKNYAVGLLWNDVDEKGEAAKEARAMAARPQIEADLFVTRAQADQFGLGWRRNGHTRGMASLAGHLADARVGKQGSWIGLFEVAGGFYLIAVRDDAILARTDKVYADERDARGPFEDLLGMADWTEVFAPEGMGFDQADGTGIEAIVASGKSPRLQDVDKVSSLVKWGLAASIVAIMVVGSLWYLDRVAEEENARVLAELAEQAKRNMPLAGGQQEIEIPPMPWDGRPVGAKFLVNCRAAMDKAVLDFPGWATRGIECDSSSSQARLLLERAAPLGSGGGTVNWIRWTLDRSPSLSKASAMPSGDNGASVSWSVDGTEKHGPVLASKTPDIGRSRFYLQSWFEEAFTPIQFPNVESNAFWRTLKFRFSTTHDPVRFSQIVDRIPGLVVDKVSVDLRRAPAVYTVEGAFFEELPPPPNAKPRNAGQAGSPAANAAATPRPNPAPQAPRS